MKLKINLRRGLKSVTRKIVANKNTIMFVAGGASVIAGEITLAASYVKNKKEFEAYKNSLTQYQDDIEDAVENNEDIPREEDVKQVKKLALMNTSVAVAKNCVVPVVLNIAGFYLMGKSFYNINKIVSQLTTALLISEMRRTKLLENVRSKYGDEEAALLNGEVKEVVDPETGAIEYVLNEDQVSNNEFIMDDRSDEWSNDPIMNRMMLEQKIKYFNDCLFLNGYVTQNDVASNLSIPGGVTVYGLLHGWTYDGDPKHDQIDFGLNDICNRAFLEGRSNRVKLRFNSSYLGNDNKGMSRANLSVNERALVAAEEHTNPEK